MGQITELVQEAHKTAVAHGWWEKEPEFGTLIALCHSELSESLEEYRDGRQPYQLYHEKNGRPEGIPVELADVVIRIFDMCGHYGIDLEGAILDKMRYNQWRDYKHGGKLI
ncbi:hypothetical protein QE152_g39961 [Popillia japonica]|uniref:Nucleotide pyrophosphohydrolase n=1 Tax=Popillia japonica TaxID=7064 RepID=A0AAW1HSN7_POPJA